MTYEEAFARIGKSGFRSRFSLDDGDRRYIAEKGLETIRRHAEDFVRQKLAPAHPPKDGRQTPMRGHPVFKAQHATATCCRGCMEKWWHVPAGVALSEARQAKAVNLIMAWIGRECGRGAEAGRKRATGATTERGRQDADVGRVAAATERGHSKNKERRQ